MKNLFVFITGSFSSVFGGIIKAFSGFVDRSTRFDERETGHIMEKMEETKKGYYRRGQSVIISEEAIKNGLKEVKI